MSMSMYTNSADYWRAQAKQADAQIARFVAAVNVQTDEIQRLKCLAWPDGPFAYGDRVRKKSGSEWEGRIVGYYKTALTPLGYAVESEAHRGSVQIYPATALEYDA